jgi:hypothetical protein
MLIKAGRDLFFWEFCLQHILKCYFGVWHTLFFNFVGCTLQVCVFVSIKLQHMKRQLCPQKSDPLVSSISLDLPDAKPRMSLGSSSGEPPAREPVLWGSSTLGGGPDEPLFREPVPWGTRNGRWRQRGRGPSLRAGSSTGRRRRRWRAPRSGLRALGELDPGAAAACSRGALPRARDTSLLRAGSSSAWEYRRRARDTQGGGGGVPAAPASLRAVRSKRIRAPSLGVRARSSTSGMAATHRNGSPCCGPAEATEENSKRRGRELTGGGQSSLFMCYSVLETKTQIWSVQPTKSKNGVCLAPNQHLRMCCRQNSLVFSVLYSMSSHVIPSSAHAPFETIEHSEIGTHQ